MQHNQYNQVRDSQIVDPIIKLMEDVRLRKTKVIIPDGDERIDSIHNDQKLKKTFLTEVTIGDNSPNFDKPVRWPNIFENLRSPNFPTAQQKIILNRLEKVPVYVVVNSTQEIVMATPRENQPYNFFDWLYKNYYNLCVWLEDDGPISIALFFFNKEDATLYLQEIAKNDPKAAEKTNLHVQLTSLDTFYKLNRTSSPGTQAKLVADLEEIYNVVSDYIPKQLHTINLKQDHSKNIYHGNPIYIIKPVVVKKGYTKILVDYKITDKNSNIYTRNIFFKLEDAYIAWDKFCDDNNTLRLPLVPNIEVYNLESYLIDLEYSDVDVVTDNYFVGTQSALTDLKQELTVIANTEEPTLARKVAQLISDSSEKLVTFSKGMLWILTSEALPTEDNSW
jgi:hypothetical protein